MASLPYIQQLSKVIVAQITQTIGWNSIQTTPLELLTDILHKYLEELTRQTQRYTELYGRTEPNLDDVALAFSDLNINIADLEEYITNVDSVPCIVNVPKFPIPKESNLNFLKPGSREVVTRPVHIHEHLPPIQPHEETPPADPSTAIEPSGDDEDSKNLIQTYISANQISDRPNGDDGEVFQQHSENNDMINVIGETTVVENHTNIPNDDATFRKPFDVPKVQSVMSQRKMNIGDAANKAKGGKPTREIISCFMTTSGFISPAREGKLPEARKPVVIPEDPEPKPLHARQRTPSPDVIERKHHSTKRDNKRDHFDSVRNSGNDSRASHDRYDAEENGKEVKLYEVIQTLPQKKKVKKSQDLAQLKELKKQKKLKQTNLKAKRNQAKFDDDGHPLPDHFVKDLGRSPDINDKLKKKAHKFDTLKKKLKSLKNPDGALYDDSMQEKQRKKRMSKLSKKNLQAMGLNPNAIEGFAIPTPHGDPNNFHFDGGNPKLDGHPKESLKKTKQQKLSTEPDKQKVKFFKKLSSTSSNLLSKTNENPYEMESRLTNQMLNPNPFAFNDEYGQTDQFHDPSNAFMDTRQMPPSMDDLPPSKRLKLLKKLNKPPKEPKTPKVKKVKKDPLLKKERTPKTPKLESPMPLPKSMPEETHLKSFINDEFRPNMGLIDEFPVPGLNPMNPLFQSMRFDLPGRDPLQSYPFAPGLPNIDFANMARFRRPNFNDPVHSDSQQLAKHSLDMNNPPPKPLCNVAPLIPPSLLNMDIGKDDYMSHEPHSSQKLDGSFGSKKKVKFSSPDTQYDQAYEDKHNLFEAPIVIQSDEDDKHRINPRDSEFGEVKRKKVKDKKDKEKKEKKDKETGVVKMKKKKDKKDKSKNKGEHSKVKDKSALKKEKREKKKERERSAAAAAALSMESNDMSAASNTFYGSQGHSEWPRDIYSKESVNLGDSSDLNASFNDNSNLETSSAIPKLTLKLAPSSPSSRTSRPSTPDFPSNKKSSKKKKKQWRLDDDSDRSDDAGASRKADETNEQSRREPSPELARISALITRPPKQKSVNKQQTTDYNTPVRNDYFDTSRSEYHSSMTTSTPLPSTPSGRGRPKGSSSLKGSKSKSSKSSVSFASDADKKFDHQSAILDPQMNVLHTIDEQANEENQVWICPACGRVDDGTPMIGCDGCDDWYHWVCVGILVPPNEDQDWFCRVCISRKQEDKKKKRKKKDKKDH